MKRMSFIAIVYEHIVLNAEFKVYLSFHPYFYVFLLDLSNNEIS